jgi:hypothetical protein
MLRDSASDVTAVTLLFILDEMAVLILDVTAW